ncbi:MAG: DUF349 domain-containing protein [Actinomycetota bacterium]
MNTSTPRPGPPRIEIPRPPAAPIVDQSGPSLPHGESSPSASFGRVADDGTVYVRTADGEREVGSYPGASPAEALAYFSRKYDEVLAHVELFERRLTTTEPSIKEATSTMKHLRHTVAELRAVGDLAALAKRVNALEPLIADQRKAAQQARKAAQEQLHAQREALVVEAEELANAASEKIRWRHDGQRMRDLFDTWQAAQRKPIGGEQSERTNQSSSHDQIRLDRKVEEDLWRRFSHARTAFDRKRRQHFSALDEQNAEAKAAKQKIVTQAEALQTSREWVTATASFKTLMTQWRSAGRAKARDDDELWQRFKAAQDVFFTARAAVLAEQDQEYAANLATKQKLLTRAEALLPITDLAHAKATLRTIQDQWDVTGKVPRGDVERIERRMRAVEQSLRDHEATRWRSTNPEAQARARSAVDQLESGITDLERELTQAETAGRAKRVTELKHALDTRREWLTQAQRALRDFGG